VRVIPWTLQSGSKQFIYNWKLEKNNLDLDQENWRQHNGMDKRKTGTKIYIEKGI
jgi:hypothetical protein